MAATGDGKGGRTITSTAVYQDLFWASAPDGGGTDGGKVKAYTVLPDGEDALIRVTFSDNSTRVFTAKNGTERPIVPRAKGLEIVRVESRGEVGAGVPIYGNVLIP